MAKKKEQKQTIQHRIVIDHVKNAGLIKELQGEDWKIIRGMEVFLVAFAKAAKATSQMTIQQFAENYLKNAFDISYYVKLHERRQEIRDAVINQKDVQRLEQKVADLRAEQTKLTRQIKNYDEAKDLELMAPFTEKEYKHKVGRLSKIAAELVKFD